MTRCVMTVMLWSILVGSAAAPAAVTAQSDSAPKSAGEPSAVTPEDRVKLALQTGEKLKNPYTDNPQAIQEGNTVFQSTCAPCHGGGGGGAICPPLSNEVWVYGSDDDVLFKLITLGSVELQKLGYKRLRTETVVGPMPPFGKIIKTDADLWKILAFVRSVYRGDPAKRNW